MTGAVLHEHTGGWAHQWRRTSGVCLADDLLAFRGRFSFERQEDGALELDADAPFFASASAGKVLPLFVGKSGHVLPLATVTPSRITLVPCTISSLWQPLTLTMMRSILLSRSMIDTAAKPLLFFLFVFYARAWCQRRLEESKD